ncbi:MAG: hypothetical protein ABI680_10690 [Chthoniobacteraceae bacterium]
MIFDSTTGPGGGDGNVTMDELRVFGRAWSADEISKLPALR